MGTSYGGYSALVSLTFTREKFACAVDLCGISNLDPFKSLRKVRGGDSLSTVIRLTEPVGPKELAHKPLLLAPYERVISLPWRVAARHARLKLTTRPNGRKR